MTWFKVDDALATHDKVLMAGNAAMGLWVRAGAWSAQHLTDGFVPTHAVLLLGNNSQARKLVDSGLWQKVDGGYCFHQWHDYQPTREKVEVDRAAARERMRKLRGAGSDEVRANTSERSGEVRDPSVRDPRPDPTRPVSVVTSVDKSSPQRETPGLEGFELQKIALATGGDMAHAEKVARHVLATSSGPVRSPLRYILAAIKERPEDHRFRRGNPTRATACPQHPGEWADNCRIHRSEGSA